MRWSFLIPISTGSLTSRGLMATKSKTSRYVIDAGDEFHGRLQKMSSGQTSSLSSPPFSTLYTLSLSISSVHTSILWMPTTLCIMGKFWETYDDMNNKGTRYRALKLEKRVCMIDSWKHFTVFSARQHAERAICYRPSVCPSVCLSHGWISQKRLKLGSCNFHRTVAPSL